jgi:hypothetical protein
LRQAPLAAQVARAGPGALPPHLASRESVFAFIRRLNFSHWLLLLYPVFLLLVQRKRGQEEAAVVDSSAMMQIGFTFLGGIIVVLRFSKTGPLLKQFLLRRPMIWILLYALLALASTAWSEKADFTLYRAIENLVFLCLIADAILSLKTFEDRLKFLLTLCLSLSVFMQWSCLVRYGFTLYNIRTSEAPGALIGATFACILIARRQWIWPYVVVVASTILAMSTASNISLLVGLTVGLLFARGAKRGLVVVLVGLLLGLAFSGVNLEEIIAPGKTQGNLETASGRIPVWEWMVKEQVSQRPILGFGFGQGEVQARLNSPGLRMMHMHNAFMSALANLGIVGASLLIVFYGEILYRVLKLRDPRVRAVLIGAAAAVMINSMSIASITAPLSMGWLGQAAFLYIIPLLYERQKSARVGGRALMVQEAR